MFCGLGRGQIERLAEFAARSEGVFGELGRSFKG